MMRSLFSGVAGLKTHQTRMDVIGNNIANVNTVGFKASSANFKDMFYQNISSATGPDAATGTAGTNAKQIGLGSQIASITTNITEQGGTSATNRALDLAINGDSFLIVKSGGATYFSKAGALNVDEQGTLYSLTNGGTIQGWMANANGEIVKDVVKDLTVMSPDNTNYAPTATSKITLNGNIDKMDPAVSVNGQTPVTDQGSPITFSFYDNLGQVYTAKMNVYKPNAAAGAAGTPGQYEVTLADVFDEDGNSIFVQKTTKTDTSTTPPTTTTSYTRRPTVVTLGGATYSIADDADIDANTGKFTLTPNGNVAKLQFDAVTGNFSSTGDTGITLAGSPLNGKGIAFSVAVGTGAGALDNTFTPYTPATDSGGVTIDFSKLTQFSTSGVSSVTYKKGYADDNYSGAGNVAGTMTGISIDDKGMVYGTYNNGSKKLLAQIAVATFSNPSGLEAVGDSLFAQTLNSGLFDGVGEAIQLSGSFTPGALEMSNVDLSQEFTTMITTQRGLQANSRIISVSDGMLEELVNLKR